MNDLREQKRKEKPSDLDKPNGLKKKPIVRVELKKDEDGEFLRPYDFMIRQEGEALYDTVGTLNDDLARSLVYQLLRPVFQTREVVEWDLNAALAMLQEIDPQDALEASLAVQMISTHRISQEMAIRSMMLDQSVEGVSENVKRVEKLNRLFLRQMESLQKYRSKGQQTIQVQHVNVNSGGQAVVGNVNTGGGDGK